MDFLDIISITFINSVSTICNILCYVGLDQIPKGIESLYLTIAPTTYVKFYQEQIQSRHPLSAGFPVDNPFVVLSICIAYLLFIYIGSAVMSQKQKFELKLFSMIHNSFLILLSLFMLVESLRQTYLLNYPLLCVGDSKDPKQIGMARIVWIFYFSKIPEMIDTIIMILKKNSRQVTFLHIYHHISIFSVWWVIQHYAPVGEPYFSVILNSFIHLLMYSYYLLSSLGFNIWWKRYLTQMQMTQFFLMMCQGIGNIYTSCDKYPYAIMQLMVWYMLSFLLLFGNFYLRSYSGEKRNVNGHTKRE